MVAHKGVHLVRYPDFAPQQRLDLMKKAYHLVFDTRGTQFVVSGYKQSILLARKL